MKNELISCKPALWDVPANWPFSKPSYHKDYSKVNEQGLKRLRKIPTTGNFLRKSLTVDLNGHVTMFHLNEKKGEYYSQNGQSLTGLMEASSATRGNKVKIY